MTRRLRAKQKVCRRLKVNLWGRIGSSFERKPYGPGEHGKDGVAKVSGYGTHLMEKQKLRLYYQNITEKQFVRLYKEAERIKGDTPRNLISLLERRLDAVVYRLKLSPTFAAARQLINHRHILVDGKVVNIPSFRVKEGSSVALRSSKMSSIPLIANAQAEDERDVPSYLSFDKKKMAGILERVPQFEDVPYPVIMDPHSVVEFYSR